MPEEQRVVDQQALDEEFFASETYWIVAPPLPPAFDPADLAAMGDAELEDMLARLEGRGRGRGQQ